MELDLKDTLELISENIIRNIIEKVECKRNNKSGDLTKGDIRVECKSFTSKGPCSFGPNEQWNEIYFFRCNRIFTEKVQVVSNETNESFSDISKHEGKQKGNVWNTSKARSNTKNYFPKIT